MRGRITLDAKHAGERSAGKPPAPFDEAGAGNVTWQPDRPVQKHWNIHRRPKSARQSSTLRASSEGWLDQQEVDLPGQQSEAP
jgi:hypothetical protein